MTFSVFPCRVCSTVSRCLIGIVLDRQVGRLREAAADWDYGVTRSRRGG